MKKEVFEGLKEFRYWEWRESGYTLLFLLFLIPFLIFLIWLFGAVAWFLDTFGWLLLFVSAVLTWLTTIYKVANAFFFKD